VAWPTEAIRLLRNLIGDDYPEKGYTYTDARLKSLITAAAVFVRMEEDFSNNYRIDIHSDTITPDPANKGTDGQNFQLLTALRAALMIAENDYRIASNKSILYKDGPSHIDLRDAASQKKAIFEAAKTRYEKAKLAYRTGDGMLGEGIVSPYNLNAFGFSKNTDAYGDAQRRRFS